jgi:WD40 repeat protein
LRLAFAWDFPNAKRKQLLPLLNCGSIVYNPAGFEPQPKRSMPMCKRLFLVFAGVALFLQGADAQQPGQATIVVFSVDGKRVITAIDKTINIADAQTQKDIARLLGHTAKITALAVSPDGKLLASGSQDKTVAVWDMPTGRQLLRIQAGGLVNNLTISGNGKNLTARTAEKTLIEWELATGKEIRKVKEK